MPKGAAEIAGRCVGLAIGVLTAVVLGALGILAGVLVLLLLSDLPAGPLSHGGRAVVLVAVFTSTGAFGTLGAMLGAAAGERIARSFGASLPAARPAGPMRGACAYLFGVIAGIAVPAGVLSVSDYLVDPRTGASGLFHGALLLVSLSCPVIGLLAARVVLRAGPRPPPPSH